MPKLILKIDKQGECNCLVRVTKEVSELLKSLSDQTGISAAKLASRMILFASENVELEE